jgi:hypothetical protein
LCLLTAVALYASHYFLTPHLFEDTPQPDFSLKNTWNIIKKLPRTIATIMNLPYMFVTLGLALNALILSSLGAFMPKYVVNQFHIEASSSALVVGGLVCLAAIFGIQFGSKISSFFQLERKGLVKFMVVTQVCLSILLHLFYYYYVYLHLHV